MAASSSSLRKMVEENGKNCNGDDSDSSELDMIDYFPVSGTERRRKVEVHQVKVRENGGNGKKKKKQRKKWEVPARIVSRKFSMVVSSVFGRRESTEKSCLRSGEGENNSQRREGEKGKGLKQRVMMPRWRGKRVFFSLRSIFSEKSGLKLLRRKIMGGSSHEQSRIMKIAMLKDVGPVNLAKIVGRRTLRMRRRMRMRMRRTAPKVIGEEEEEEEDDDDDEEEEEKEETEEGDAELCNKRILMGGKCRPLSVSGGGGENVDTAEEDAEQCKKRILMESSDDLRNPKTRTEGEEDAELRKMEEKCRPLNSSDIVIHYLKTINKKGDGEKEEEEEEENSEGEDAELCKKRILMGEKCRPLLPE